MRQGEAAPRRRALRGGRDERERPDGATAVGTSHLSRALPAHAQLRRPMVRLILLGLVLAVLAIFFVLDRSKSSARSGDVLTEDAVAFWTTLDPAHVSATSVAGPQGERALKLELLPHRRYYTVVRHAFARPLNWTNRPYVLLNLWTDARTGPVVVYLDFAAAGRGFVEYSISRAQVGWRQVALGTATPEARKGAPRWDHVVALRVSTPSKDVRSAFALGRVEVAAPVDLR